jgi:hypothetical protein
MDLRFCDERFTRTPELFYALQLYQLGYLASAREHLMDLTGAAETAEVAGFYIALIDRALAGPGGGGWTLNLPDLPGLWELDWLRALFGPASIAEVVDRRTAPPADRSIIVEHRLTEEKQVYYRRNFELGLRQVMVHLGDEYYVDSCSAYRWCERVYRNYWSPITDGLSHVTVFPLGYKVGFARSEKAPRPVSQRPYLWSFVGDPNKATRENMLDHLRRVDGGFEHLISGWNSADSLSTADYRAVLDQTVFSPCPAGNGNLDTYRVYESLEAGCIPILERRAGYDYFDRLLPGHPMLVVLDWSQARDLIGDLVANDGCEALRLKCQGWWSSYKDQFIARVRADLGAGAGLGSPAAGGLER